MKKKLLSILLVGAMVATTLVGCGGASEEEGPSGNGGTPQVEKFEKFDELQKIKVKCMDIIPSDNTARDAAINAISKEKINVEVEIEQVDIVSYMNQLPLTLSSGEVFDLVMFTAIPACGFTTMQAQNQLMDVTQYVDKYAPDMKAGLGTYLGSTTVNGKIYGFPNYRQYDSGIYLMMREDVLDDLGLTDKARNATTWAEVEEIFEAVAPKLSSYGIQDVFGPTDNQGTMLTPGNACLGGDAFADAYAFDSLGDTYKFIHTDPSSDKVVNAFEQDIYKSAMTRANNWYKKGWVRKKALSDRDNSGDAGFGNDCYFSYLSTAEYGVEMVKEGETGKSIVAIKIVDTPISTQSGRQWGWGVPNTSTNPQAALAFLNLAFTNADIANLFCFGVEGEDYNVVDGEAHINFAKDGGAYMSGDFLYPNQFIALAKQGLGGDFRQKAEANMKNHPVSKYYGIAIDATPVSNEITNVKTVLDAIQLPLEAGQKDPSTCDELSQKALAAGLDKIIEFYQGQIDAFIGQ